MATISFRWKDDGLRQFDNMIKAVGDQAPKALQRAVARAGDQAKTQVIRTLTKQTGLPRRTIVKAVKVTRPSWTNLAYTMTTEGGKVSVKYFSPRETKKGVVAKPFGSRTLFPLSFMKGGKWPDRTGNIFAGHAFRRIGGKRLPIEKTKTDVVIPDQMLQGATLQVFNKTVDKVLPKRVEHELGRLLK